MRSPAQAAGWHRATSNTFTKTVPFRLTVRFLDDRDRVARVVPLQLHASVSVGERNVRVLGELRTDERVSPFDFSLPAGSLVPPTVTMDYRHGQKVVAEQRHVGLPSGKHATRTIVRTRKASPHEWGVHIDGVEVFHEIGGRVDIDSGWMR